jgi:hypothetical protein
VIEIVWQARLRSFGNFHKNLSEQKKKEAVSKQILKQ